MKIVFELCNTATQRQCFICAEDTDRRSIHAVLTADDGAELGFLCEECILIGVERVFNVAWEACPPPAEGELDAFDKQVQAAAAEWDALNKRVQDLESWAKERTGSPVAQAADGGEGGEA